MRNLGHSDPKHFTPSKRLQIGRIMAFFSRSRRRGNRNIENRLPEFLKSGKEAMKRDHHYYLDVAATKLSPAAIYIKMKPPRLQDLWQIYLKKGSHPAARSVANLS
jgi:hypothetical protein